MVGGDGLFKPSLQLFSAFFDKKQLQLSEKQALYEILDTLKFAAEPPEFAAEPPKFAEDRYSGRHSFCKKTRKSDGLNKPSPQTITR